MHQFVTIAVAVMALAGRDGGPLEFQDSTETTAAQKAKASKIEPSRSQAALKFFVIEKDKGPVKGVVIVLRAPSGTKYYTEETDQDGYAEVLVPVGQDYEATYLSLGLARGDLAAKVPVPNEPRQTMRLTLRYKRIPTPPFVLTGVNFDTGKATIRPESFTQLDIVVDFMAHKKSARVEISGHTDNVGNAKANKALSAKRAQACRAYLVSKGIEGARITAVGYGSERPAAPNDSDLNREKNRRIEVVEVQTAAK